MTPRAVIQQLQAIRAQVEKVSRVDTRYRQNVAAALRRLHRLEAALLPLCPKPGPKPKGGRP